MPDHGSATLRVEDLPRRACVWLKEALMLRKAERHVGIPRTWRQ